MWKYSSAAQAAGLGTGSELDEVINKLAVLHESGYLLILKLSLKVMPDCIKQLS